MFISEETYQKLIGPARAKYKPYLPTLESQIEHLFNHIPGVVFLSAQDFQLSPNDDLFAAIEFYLLCTKDGLANYFELFELMVKEVQSEKHLSASLSTRYLMCPEDYSDLETLPIKVRQGYVNNYESVQEMTDKKYRYLATVKEVLSKHVKLPVKNSI